MLCLNSCSKKTNSYIWIKLSVLKQVKRCCATLPISLNLETGPFFMPNVPCSLVKIGRVVLEKIFKFCQCISIISQLSPLGKGHGLSFKQTWIFFTTDVFCYVWLKLAQWFCDENVKPLQMDRWTNGRKDDRWKAIRKAHLNYQLRWAKNLCVRCKFMSSTN